jgi:hypothetical protein
MPVQVLMCFWLVDRPPPMSLLPVGRVVIDGGILKHEQSY